MATVTKNEGAPAPHNSYGNAIVDESDMHPPHYGMSTREYLATRISTLKPPMTKAPNPIRLVRMLNRHQWAFFGVAFWAWVSLTVFSSSSFFVLLLLTVFDNMLCKYRRGMLSISSLYR